jgi:predicted transcriptional regulator
MGRASNGSAPAPTEAADICQREGPLHRLGLYSPALLGWCWSRSVSCRTESDIHDAPRVKYDGTMSEASISLQALGFSESEAKAYVALLERGDLTGYQLAKASGIPRPNIYGVLDRLQARGVVSSVKVRGGQRFNALHPSEMLDSLRRAMEGDMEKAEQALSQVQGPPETEVVLNIRGRVEVMARARALIERTRKGLLVAIWRLESEELASQFREAESRGISITTLCVQGCEEQCESCRGEVHRFKLETNNEVRSVVLVADDDVMLAGQFSSAQEPLAALSHSKAFVTVARQYIRNSIAVAEIVRSVGSRLLDLVDARALLALRAAKVVGEREV